VDQEQRSHLTAGLLLIGIGLVFFFGQLHWPFAHVFRIGLLWPLILLAIGIGKLMQPVNEKHPGARGAGGWLVFIAVLFLLNNYDVLPISRAWPLFVVAAGVTMITHRSYTRRAGEEGRSDV
jgi:hypothetical protein